MLEKHALLFVLATGTISEIKWMASITDREGKDGDDSRALLCCVGHRGLFQLRQACVLSDLDAVVPELDRVSAAFDRLKSHPEYTLETIGQALKHLLSRIHDELAGHYYFHLDQGDVPFYVDAHPFGSGASAKFPKAVEDIAEAGKCLAFQRPTACVFHLMRVLELGVQALGKKLKVKIDVRTETWHQIMLHVEKAVQPMPSKTSGQRTRKAAYATAASYLQTVRLAWRNEVMHPKQTYTRQEAFDIFSASKAFMAYLAALV